MKGDFFNHIVRWIAGIGIGLALLAAGDNTVRCQQPWNFTSLDEACRDDAWLVLPPDSIRLAVERSAKRAVEYNTSYHISGPYRTLTGRWVRFQNDDADFRVAEEVAALLLPYMVSHRYWSERYRGWTNWTFVDMNQVTTLVDVDTADHRYGHFSPLGWHGYTFQPSEEWPVVFTISTNTGQRQTLTLRAMERLAKWGAFNTYDEMKARMRREEEQQRREAARANLLQREIDSLAGIAQWAGRQADSLLVELQDDSLAAVAEQNRAEVERAKARMNRDEIFIMNIKPAHSEYMFGLEYNFYNCFQKTITKIEITVTPYNDRSRVQEDKFHRSVRTVRCMGPIRPESPAQYLFDELFWDDKGRIKYMRTTSITFHFTDGTTKSYNGYNQIMKHSLK